MEQSRLAAIDGLRGVAALCVAVFHFQELFAAKPFFQWGYLNVDLFFILSGFILSKVYEQRLRSGLVTGPRFFWRRLVRLWPLHVVTLFLMVLIERVMWTNTGFHVLVETDSRSAFGLNLALLQHIGLLDSLTWNKPSWSISVELVVNLTWAAAVLGGVWSLGVAAVVAVAGTAVLYSVRGNLNNELEMAFGVLNAGILRAAVGFSIGYMLNRLRPHSLGATALPTVAAAALALVILHFDTLPGIDYVCLWLIFPVIVLAAVDERTWISKVLSTAPCALLGRVSYSVYLLHYPVYLIVANGNLFLYSRPFGVDMLQPPTIGIVYLIVLLACSVVSYSLIESPALRLGSIGCGLERKKQQLVTPDLSGSKIRSVL